MVKRYGFSSIDALLLGAIRFVFIVTVSIHVEFNLLAQAMALCLRHHRDGFAVITVSDSRVDEILMSGPAGEVKRLLRNRIASPNQHKMRVQGLRVCSNI